VKPNAPKSRRPCRRRHAALNILVRDRLDQAVTGFVNAGMSPKKALLAVLEGTQNGVEGGRNSAAALSMAYEKRYIGGMLGEMQAEKPHLIAMLGDKQFDGDVLREMAELKEGGKPGITGNADAIYTAKMFAKYAELSRTDLNRLGASIGKLDGWAGAQSHDDMRMIEAGKTTWVDHIIPKLDLAKTFPDISSVDDLKNVLGDIYDTIITGMPNKPTAAELGQRVSPANLAKSLGKSRVLHFRDAEAAKAYQRRIWLWHDRIRHDLASEAGRAHGWQHGKPRAKPEVMFGFAGRWAGAQDCRRSQYLAGREGKADQGAETRWRRASACP
jgi:hypothetical protein